MLLVHVDITYFLNIDCTTVQIINIKLEIITIIIIIIIINTRAFLAKNRSINYVPDESWGNSVLCCWCRSICSHISPPHPGVKLINTLREGRGTLGGVGILLVAICTETGIKLLWFGPLGPMDT